MVKRIWFKPGCVEWIKRGAKTTTFRSNEKRGVYDVVEGSWFDATPVGLRLKLTPINMMSGEDVIKEHYGTEGPFKSPPKNLGIGSNKSS